MSYVTSWDERDEDWRQTENSYNRDAWDDPEFRCTDDDECDCLHCLADDYPDEK